MERWSLFQAEMNSNCLKAQGSMMAAVACASVPKITVVVGGSHGVDSYAMVGECKCPSFWAENPNFRICIMPRVDSAHLSSAVWAGVWAELSVPVAQCQSVRDCSRSCRSSASSWCWGGGRGEAEQEAEGGELSFLFLWQNVGRWSHFASGHQKGKILVRKWLEGYLGDSLIL